MKNSDGQDSDSLKDIDFEEPKTRKRIRTKSFQANKQKPFQEIDQLRVRKSERQQAQSQQKERQFYEFILRDRNIQNLRQEESKDHFLNYEVPKKIMMLEEAMLLQGLRNSIQTANQEQDRPQIQMRSSLNNDLNIEHTLRAGGGQPEYEKMQKIIGKYFGIADIQIIVKSPKIGILEQLQINASPNLQMTQDQIKILQQPKLTSMQVMIQNQDDNGIIKEIKFLLLIDYLYSLGIIEKAINQNISIQPDYNICTIGLEGEKQQQVMQLHNLIQNVCKYVIVTYPFSSQEDLQMFMEFISKIKQIKDDIIEITYINSFNQIRLQNINDAIKIKFYLENNYIYGLISNINNIPIKNLQEIFNSLIDNINDSIKQDEESMYEEECSESYLSEANIILQENKIQCWNLYLKKKYNNDSIQATKEQDKLILKLLGDHEYVVQLQKQIEIQLSTLKYSTLRFFVPDLNPKLLTILNQHPINQIFWCDINKIKEVTQAQYLQLQEIDVKNSFISFAVVHEQQDQLLIAALKKMFIKQLEFHFVDVDLNQVLDYSQLSKQQFEIKYNCFIQLTDQQQSYVTLSQHNDKIKQLIQDYLKTVANFSTLKLIVTQKFLQNLIKEALKSGLINKNIQVDCLNDTFILKGNEEFLTQAEVLITDYKQQMINQFSFKDFTLTLKQWGFLQKYHLKEIQNIEEQHQCIIILQSNEQIQEDRKFAQKIQIESEEVQFVQSLDIVQEFIDISIGCKDTSKFQEIENILLGMIKNNTELIDWQVLNLQKADLEQAQEFILKNSILTKGILKYGNQIQIQCTKKKVSKLNEYLLNLKEKLVYPQNWIAQEDNFISVELQKDSEEFKKVFQLFVSSYRNGIIYQINRLQNKALYNNFHLEKVKLSQLRQKNDIVSEHQIEKFLWHGVKGLHPMAIYNGQKEAFDHTYSNNNSLWGPGIYFSQSAEYSRKYSYTLKENDSVKYKGKKVMLLCLVYRGKVAYMKQDINIRRPPDNFDCVGGQTENTEITVLYGMDVRRAYPYYEIIFE